MEVKDTVTPACRLCSSASNQAEISFKAGKQEGRREVVEWIESRRLPSMSKGIVTVLEIDWQTQVKEWGL